MLWRKPLQLTALPTMQIVNFEYDEEEQVYAILFKPEGACHELRIVRRSVRASCAGVGSATRMQFPLIPSHAVTVHRVQGATLDGDVHVLLNSEFFAAGQAYTALSRARRMSQLHLDTIISGHAHTKCSGMAHAYTRHTPLLYTLPMGHVLILITTLGTYSNVMMIALD